MVRRLDGRADVTWYVDWTDMKTSRGTSIGRIWRRHVVRRLDGYGDVTWYVDWTDMETSRGQMVDIVRVARFSTNLP